MATETWILAGGRWKVISERGLLRLVILAALLAFAGGTFCGFLVMNVSYEKRIAQLEREVAKIETAWGIK